MNQIIWATSPEEPIILGGLTGVGKTFVGKALAHHLNMVHVDTDAVFKERHGVIGKLETEEAINAFREKEAQIVSESIRRKGVVVSVGGGSLLNKENQKIAKKSPNLIILMSNVEDIAQRIMDDKINTRPLLTDRKEEIVLFLESRMEHYLSFEKILTLDREEPIEKTIANLMRILRLEAKIHKIPR